MASIVAFYQVLKKFLENLNPERSYLTDHCHLLVIGIIFYKGLRFTNFEQCLYVPTASISWVRRSFPLAFIAIFDPSSSEDPCFRMKCFDAGANMVSHDVKSLLHTLDTCVLSVGRSGGRYTCPYCPATGLTERDLYYHCPAFHINIMNENIADSYCPICEVRIRSPMQVQRFLVLNFAIAIFRILLFNLFRCNNFPGTHPHGSRPA